MPTRFRVCTLPTPPSTPQCSTTYPRSSPRSRPRPSSTACGATSPSLRSRTRIGAVLLRMTMRARRWRGCRRGRRGRGRCMRRCGIAVGRRWRAMGTWARRTGGAMKTDTKRARFRADSTMHDDKLVSCERLRCGMSPRSTRKRGRLVADVEGDEDECDEQSLTSSHPSTNTSPQSSNSRKKARTHAHLPKSKPDSAHEASNKMDIDDAPPALTLSSSPNPQSRASKPKSKPKSTATPKPKTSSPLVLAPPFTSRPSSPDHAHAHATNKGKVQVVIMSASPRSRKDSVSASVSPERGRERKGPSAAVAKAKTRGTGMRKGKASVKALGEVVDSSVDAERMSEA
ncbi:hypothetical protein H2248_005534 [Termitomyces sp. 'cryptogamus']|nr:hypothetical protein H2248_005534 [Termitomyces sp. 'cryptogamus']